ncbi:MAG: alpha/beta hydrolase fold domain-containing protein [Lachnospiraceae bacterium]
MRVWLGICMLFLAFYFTGCHSANVADTRQYVSEIKPGVYTTFIVEQLDVTMDVIYDSDKELGMDVYMAESEVFEDMSRAGIILFHGGGFTKGDKSTDELTKALSIDLSRMGYVVFNVNYSISDKANLAAIKNACKDAETAIKYIQEHCEEYEVDKHHLALGGYSAGALLAMDFVYSNNYDIDTNDIFAVIDIAGGKLSFGAPNGANPACLIIHGTDDTTVPYSDSENFAQKLEKKNVPYEFFTIEKIGHQVITEFDNIRNKSAEFLYNKLTGKSVSIDLKSKTNPEYAKVEKRMKNGIDYILCNPKCVPDGDISEWKDCQRISLDKLKDAGKEIPSQDIYEGFVYVGVNQEEPNKIYLALDIKDDTISVSNAKGSKWYNDDCIEIAFDFSDENKIKPIYKWVISADGSKLSEKANSNNTKVYSIKKENTTTYEIEIDLSEYGFTVNSNLHFGMSIAYNNARNGVREYQLGWTAGASSDRTLFANVRKQ